MNQNLYEIFQNECPELAARFYDPIEAQKALRGLDAKTKQLINIASRLQIEIQGVCKCTQ